MLRKLLSGFLAALTLLASGPAPAQVLHGAGLALVNHQTQPYEGLVAARGRIPDNQQGATFINGMARTGLLAADNITTLKVAFANFSIQSGAEGGSGGTLTVNDAAIEYPIGSTRQRLLFGGANSRPACATATVCFSDYLTLTTTIPAGAVFRVWFYETMSTGVGVLKRLANGDTATYGDVASLGTVGSPATNTVMSGSAPTSNIGTGYVPVAAVIAYTRTPSAAVLGDSIGWAVNYDTVTADGRFGLPSRALPANFAFINLSSNAALMTTTRSVSAARRYLYPYVSHAFVELGINDLNTQTTAQIKAAATALASDFPAFTRKIHTTLLPDRATSTDGYTTLAGQSLSSDQTKANAWNAEVRNGTVDGFSGFVETSDVASSARDSGKWPIPAGARTVTDAAITTGTTTLTSATASFTSADVGMGVTVNGAGISAAALKTWITVFTNSTTVTVNNSASTTVTVATAFLASYTTDGLHPSPGMFSLVATPAVIPAPVYR